MQVVPRPQCGDRNDGVAGSGELVLGSADSAVAGERLVVL